MRHQKKGHKLGRTSSHRHALLRNLAASLIVNVRIETTLAKAKALRPYIEPLITKAVRASSSICKNQRRHQLRQVLRHVPNFQAASILLNVWGNQFVNRPGGYTRIIKLGMRSSDAAPMALIEMIVEKEQFVSIVDEIYPYFFGQVRGILCDEADAARRLYSDCRAQILPLLPLPKFVFRTRTIADCRCGIEVCFPGKLPEAWNAVESSMYPISYYVHIGDGELIDVAVDSVPSGVYVVSPGIFEVRYSAKNPDRFLSLTVERKRHNLKRDVFVRLFRETGTTVVRTALNAPEVSL